MYWMELNVWAGIECGARIKCLQHQEDRLARMQNHHMGEQGVHKVPTLCNRVVIFNQQKAK
jgi:hypothetical protein